MEDKCECSITFLYQIGIIWVRMGLAIHLCCVDAGLRVCVCMCVTSNNYISYVYLFVHEEISICVYTRCSKVEDGADSLCAVYYRILCNYIITANHPPEVA